MTTKLPNKDRARFVTGKAIKSGLLIRKSCQECGGKKVHAHHTDYSRPLEVLWLCQKHHSEWHKVNGFPDGERDRSFIPLAVEVHKELSILKAKEGKTFNKMVEKLIKFYQANK